MRLKTHTGETAKHGPITLNRTSVKSLCARHSLWNQGLIEGAWLIRIRSTNPPGQRISAAVDMDAKGTTFFRPLLDELYLREPTIRPPDWPRNPSNWT